MVPPELLMVLELEMLEPPIFDNVMVPELSMVPPELLRMPMPPLFDIVMVPELEMVPKLSMPTEF